MTLSQCRKNKNSSPMKNISWNQFNWYWLLRVSLLGYFHGIFFKNMRVKFGNFLHCECSTTFLYWLKGWLLINVLNIKCAGIQNAWIVIVLPTLQKQCLAEICKEFEN